MAPLEWYEITFGGIAAQVIAWFFSSDEEDEDVEAEAKNSYRNSVESNDPCQTVEALSLIMYLNIFLVILSISNIH